MVRFRPGRLAVAQGLALMCALAAALMLLRPWRLSLVEVKVVSSSSNVTATNLAEIKQGYPEGNAALHDPPAGEKKDARPEAPDEGSLTRTAPEPGYEPKEGPTTGLIYVHVAGHVVKPGLYGMGSGARVHHAVEAAGGLSGSADKDAVNLALPISDGQQIYIPAKKADTMSKGQPQITQSTKPESASAAVLTDEPRGRLDVTLKEPVSEATESAPAGKIGINSASQSELEKLPGIGPATAAKILQHRKDKGPFTSIEGLLDVSGIGPAKFAAIKDLVSLR